MVSLANASREFIDVFREGVAAYDEDDQERAYSLFGEALEIEPDNVWALLWRGATAPTASDTELWLEQALELEPDNTHAHAGLEWAREAKTVEEAGALDVAEPEPTVEDVEPEEIDEAAFDWLDEEPADEETVADDTAVADAETFFEEEDDVPDWLRDEDEEDTSAAVLDVEREEAFDEEEDDVPDWLRDEEEDAGETTADAAVVDEDEFIDFDEDEEDVPDWLLEEEEDEDDFFDEPEAPATTTEAEPTDESGLPAWLTEEEEAEEAVVEEPVDVYETPEGSLEAPNETVAAFQAGLDAYDKNNLEDAQRHFERTIQLDDRHVEAHNYLGSVYFLQGRTDEAIVSFDRALQLDDSHAESYLNLGLVYQETGDRQKAVQMFEKYLDLDPDSSIADDVRGFIASMS